MSRHHLVVIANYVRDTGMTLIDAMDYIGDNWDEINDRDPALINAYEDTFEELLKFVATKE
jgi:hypothetical protein